MGTLTKQKLGYFPLVQLNKQGTNTGYIHNSKYHLWLCYEGWPFVKAEINNEHTVN